MSNYDKPIFGIMFLATKISDIVARFKCPICRATDIDDQDS